MPYMKKKYCFLLCLLLLFLLAGACGENETVILTDAEGSMQELPETDAEEPQMSSGDEGMEDFAKKESESASVCVIHICGAVHEPGLYTLPAGSRIGDAVERAGGFLESADESASNLAQLLYDGEQIVILTKEEAALFHQKAEESPGTRKADSETDGLVNINKASLEQLCTLPGIGESRANAIIAYREKNGPFGAAEDIMKVKGIKEAAFEKLKDRIKV